MMTEERATKLVEQIPDAVLFAAAKNRREQGRQEKGKYWTLKKFRVCNGCHKEMTTRELYNHTCRVPKNQR